jgi:hypothetical protein
VEAKKSGNWAQKATKTPEHQETREFFGAEAACLADRSRKEGEFPEGQKFLRKKGLLVFSPTKKLRLAAHKSCVKKRTRCCHS